MKNMLLQFEESDYDMIPNPKRTWVMDLVRVGLRDLREQQLGGGPDVEYVFEWEHGRVEVSGGGSPLEALMRLGFDKDEAVSEARRLKRFATADVARRGGWYPEEEVPRETQEVESKGVDPFDV